MKARSPLVGYNHNLRYAGRQWHVQTEDSGIQNPHVFTHLFFDGTIFATKKADYSPYTSDAEVQKLMQLQHKTMMRELKAGAFDEKITQMLGIAITDFDDEERTDPSERTPVPALLESSVETQPIDIGAPVVSAAETEPIVIGSLHESAVKTDPITIHSQPVASSPAPGPTPSPRRPTGQWPTPPKPGVLVARPAMIVGGDKSGKHQAWKPPTPQNAGRVPRITPATGKKTESSFGEPEAESTLDEVIISYLTEGLPKKE